MSIDLTGITNKNEYYTKGDMRIIEILIAKEEQALNNIGDPSLLLGKFTIHNRLHSFQNVFPSQEGNTHSVCG